MTKSYLTRALLLAGLMAAAGTASAAFIDDESAELSSSHTETWLFPDGSSHTVSRTDFGAPDTTSLGAGPEPMTDQSSEYLSSSGMELWSYPDGTSPDGTSRNLAEATTTDFDMSSELTTMGAGPAPSGPTLLFESSLGGGSSLGLMRQEPIYTVAP